MIRAILAGAVLVGAMLVPHIAHGVVGNGVEVKAYAPFASGRMVFGIGSVTPLVYPVRARMTVVLSFRGRVVARERWTVMRRKDLANAIAAKVTCRRTRARHPWTTTTLARSVLAGRSRTFVVRSRRALLRCGAPR